LNWEKIEKVVEVDLKEKHYGECY
jgi:hypothetical protein